MKSLYFHKDQCQEGATKSVLFPKLTGNRCFPVKFVNVLEAPILWNVFERLLLTFWLQTLVTHTITDFQTVGISRKLQEVVLLKTWFCENTNKFKWKHMQRSRFLHLQLYLKMTPTPALHCEFQPNGSFNTCFWKVLADF